MQENEFYKKLVNRYAENQATDEELEVFFQLLKGGKLDANLTDKMMEDMNGEQAALQTPVRRMSVWFQIAAASVVLILIAGVIYFTNNKPEKLLADSATKAPSVINDIVPGGHKAVLTLADGSTIILDSANNGALTQQGNVQIVKLDDGQLSYSNEAGKNSGEILYNTITTPKGGQYQLTLSDGSQVWLNAESSIRFPASFTGKERQVEMTGEGYFEVAHNAAMPFHVLVNNVDIKVLGTHFNVNAYADDRNYKVTLLEGSVKINNGIQEALLSPGWQAGINKTGNIDIARKVNLDEVMAWKNGKFIFDKADIQTVMKRLSRWYDMDVAYVGNVSAHFGGDISMDVPISKVFEMLEMTGGVKFEIAGNKVKVLPGKIANN